MTIKLTKRNYRKTSVKEVIKLYNQGLNFSQIARTLGCSRNTIKNKINEHVRETGKPIMVRGKPGLSDEQIDKAISWYYSGRKVSDIAKDLDVSRAYIYSLLKRYT